MPEAFRVGLTGGIASGKDTPIAFGPFLAIAGWLGMICGHAVVVKYLSLFAHRG